MLESVPRKGMRFEIDTVTVAQVEREAGNEGCFEES